MPTEYMEYEDSVQTECLSFGSEVCLKYNGLPVGKAKVISYPASEEGMHADDKHRYVSVQLLLRKRNSIMDMLPYRKDLRRWSDCGRGTRLAWRTEDVHDEAAYANLIKAMDVNKRKVNYLMKMKKISKENAEPEVQEDEEPEPAEERDVQEDEEPEPAEERDVQDEEEPEPAEERDVQDEEEPEPAEERDVQDEEEPEPAEERDVQEDEEPEPAEERDVQDEEEPEPAEERDVQDEEELDDLLVLETRIDLPEPETTERYNVDDFVEVCFCTKVGRKTTKTIYYGQVVDVEPFYVSFMKSTMKDHIKVWPQEADMSIVESTEIIRKLSKPDQDRRGRLIFKH